MNRLLIVILAICTIPPYAQGAEPDAAKKKAEALLQKINQLQKQVGPEFVTLDNILNGLDLTSPDGREIALIIQTLNESCPY